MQGGTNAVIMDPQIGDIGLASFCSHDLRLGVAIEASAHLAAASGGWRGANRP
jgi:hypothetical protein